MAQTESRVKLVFEGSERGVVAAASKSIAALKALGDENTKVGKKFEAVDKQATKFIKTVTKTAAVTSLVAAGGGLIGQAFVGASAALTELGFASLTVKLGMDGIKKAAEGAKKPFDDLKKAVSGTFERGLKHPVADVAALLPKLTAGFTGVAASISGMAGQVVRVGASAEGVAKLQSILAGTRVFIDGMAPGLARLVDGFLTIASNATPSMRELGAAFGDVFGKLGDVLRNLPFDTVNAAVRAFSATLSGIGSVIGSVVNLAVRLGAALGDSLGVVLDNLAAGLDKASPGLTDLAGAVGELLKAAAPLLPVIGELAGQFAGALASGIRTVIPYVQQFAAWAQNNIGTIKAIVEGIIALALAVKALNIFTTVVGWADTAIAAVTRFGGSAEGAGAKTGVFAGKLGLLKGIGVAVALAGIAVAMDRINTSAAGGADKLTGFAGELHDIARILTGDWGNPFDDINAQLDETVRNIQSGKSAFGEFLGFIKRSMAEKLPPLTFDLNTGPAQAQLDGFIAGVNRNAPQVNINGNTNGAAFALREILAEIAAGKSEVTIDGRSIPAQEALQFVIGLINNSNPEVNINGNNRPAGDALAEFLRNAQGSTATAQLNADPTKARETVGGWTRFTEGTTGIAQMSANPAQANSVREGWKAVTSATVGVAHLNAEPGGANATVAGWRGSANATTGTAHLNAEPGGANATTSGWQGGANRTTATAHLNAESSAADRVLGSLYRSWAGRIITWTVNLVHGLGFAEGGPVFGARASGGPIRGPGTGTSDTAGLFRLSNGEHVLTAREVQAAGGHAAIFAMRRALVAGRVPRMSARSGRGASGGAVTPAGALTIPAPQVNVQVHVDGNEVRSIVRTEITQASRATRRTVLAGAGTSF
jgi:hypothetical protein